MTETLGKPGETERVNSLIAMANTVGDRLGPPPPPVDDHVLPWSLFFVGIAALVIGGFAGFVLGKSQVKETVIRAQPANPPVEFSIAEIGTIPESPVTIGTVTDSTTSDETDGSGATASDEPTSSDPAGADDTDSVASPTTTTDPGPTTTEPPPPFPAYLAVQLAAIKNFAIYDGESLVLAGQMSTKDMADEWEDHVDSVFDVPVVNEVSTQEDAGAATGVISFPGVCYFEVGSASLRPDCQALLGSIARAVIADPDATISVSGHSDSDDSPNRIERASQNRANAAVLVLVREGVPESRITALPRGANDPAGDNATTDGRARNRRIDITIDNLRP
jgi:outer membrane protein OmpA-like peptidoglycan-associated protein